MKLTEHLKKIDRDMKLTKSVEKYVKKGLKEGKKGLKIVEKGISVAHKELFGSDTFIPENCGSPKVTYNQIPLPPAPPDGVYSAEYFQSWMDALQADWDSRKPSVDGNFAAVLTTVEEAAKAHDAAQKILNKLEKQKDPPAPKTELDQAKAALIAEKSALDECMSLLQEASPQVLDQLDLMSDSFDDANLASLFVLKNAPLDKLADWCNKGQVQQEQLITFLQDVPFMKRILSSGGPYSFSELGRALEIYHQIKGSQDLTDPVLERLALAVALELCVDLTLFGYSNKHVDPLLRFVHYSQAYLMGELDPAFSGLSVWELRMVVDCNAPDDQIGWGRRSLQNYRPDLCYMSDPQWRYCRIVRTDVAYREPDFYKPVRTYDQILSGGGKCGPRAWYGRFACKSFGIPTWGVRQPGHAAMSRWTMKQQWMTCLGAGFEYSWWNDRGSPYRGGNDFYLETCARMACPSDLVYLSKVQRIEWMAFVAGESDKSIRTQSPVPATAAPWYALSMMQRRIVSAKGPVQETQLKSPRKLLQTKLETVVAQPDTDGPMEWTSVGKLVIPAAAFSQKNQLDVAKSYLGGRQAFLHGDGSVEYQIPSQILLSVNSSSLSLQIRICTVHRQEEPLKLTATSVNGESTLTDIVVPYTMGEWGMTEPIQLPSKLKSIKINRNKQPFGISYKDLILTPV